MFVGFCLEINTILLKIFNWNLKLLRNWNVYLILFVFFFLFVHAFAGNQKLRSSVSCVIFQGERAHHFTILGRILGCCLLCQLSLYGECFFSSLCIKISNLEQEIRAVSCFCVYATRRFNPIAFCSVILTLLFFIPRRFITWERRLEKFSRRGVKRFGRK